MHITAQQITGLLLAGGEGQRMGGLDKGLQGLHGEPLAAHVMRRLSPQVGTVLISANRHIDQYRQLGCEVIADQLSGFHGPLAGIHTGLLHCDTPWLLTVPCDSPFLPQDLAQRLIDAIVRNEADLAYAVTGSGDHHERREHPVFSLMRTELRDSLARYLEGGGRKVREWQASTRAVAVPFPDEQAFRNLNTVSELAEVEAEAKAEAEAEANRHPARPNSSA